jgi:hypothetical protein
MAENNTLQPFKIKEASSSFKIKSLEDRMEEDVIQRQTQIAASVDEDNWDTTDTMLTTRAFIDGLVLNKAEEIGSWPAALAYKMLNPIDSQGTSISDIRNQMVEGLEAESAVFREEHPYAAVSANIAGGVLSPVSLKGGQILSQARGLRQAENLRRSAQATPILGNTAGSVAASRANAMAASGMRPSAFNAASYSPQGALAARAYPVAQASAFAGVEGAAFGYEGDDKLQNAATTGLISAAFPPLLAGGGAILNQASKTRISQQLGKGSEFVNLMFTESGAANVYRHLIAKSFGGAGLVEQQVRSLANRVSSSDTLKKQGVKLTEDAKKALKRASKASSGSKVQAVEEARFLKEEALADLSLQGKLNNLELDEAASKRITALDDVANRSKLEVEAFAVKEADAAVNASEAAFRSNALKSAVPSQLTGDAANDILTLPPQKALEFLDQKWKELGFSSAKRVNYSIDNAAVLKDVKRMAADNPEVMGLLGQAGNMNSVVNYLEQTLGKSTVDGVIRGKDLIGVRSNIGTFLNSLSDNKFVVGRFVDDVQNYLDDVILKQLSGEARESFVADRGLWRNKRMTEEAINKATGRGRDVQGAFTADDWIEAAKTNNRWLASRGNVVLQKEAQEQAALNRARDSQIKTLADKKTVEIINEAKVATQAQKETLSRARVDAAKSLGEQRRQIVNTYRDSAKSAADQEARDMGLLTVKQQHEQQLSGLDEAIVAAKGREAELKALSSGSSAKMSIFEKSFASGVLGTLAAGTLGMGKALGNVGAIALGSTVGAVGARQSVQRAVAGQTAPQQALQRGLSIASDINDSLTARGAGLAQSSAVLPGVAAQQGTVIPIENREAVLNLRGEAKKKARERIQQSKKSERLRREDPEVFRHLFSS